MNHLQLDNVSKGSMIQRALRYNVVVSFDISKPKARFVQQLVSHSARNAKSDHLSLLSAW